MSQKLADALRRINQLERDKAEAQERLAAIEIHLGLRQPVPQVPFRVLRDPRRRKAPDLM